MLSREIASIKPNKFARYTAFTAGIFYLLVTLTLFVNPLWFFENVGHFPPFNRHYMGDLASFLFPVAIGLTVAARDPYRYRLIIGIAAAGSVIHTFNHGYDAVVERITHGH